MNPLTQSEQAAAALVSVMRDMQRDSPELLQDRGLRRGFEKRVAEFLAPGFVPKQFANELEEVFLDVFGAETVAEEVALRPPFVEVVGGGWFGDLLTYTAPGKSVPQFYYGAAMAWLAGGCGRRPRIDFEVGPLFPNLYLLVIGGPGSGKGSSFSKIRDLIQPVHPPFMLPEEGTPQGFMAMLQTRWEDTGESADGMIEAEEMSTLISAEKHKAEVVTWLTAQYDKHGAAARALKGDPTVHLENPCVTLLGASNVKWVRLMPQEKVMGGFFQRCVKFVCWPEEEKKPLGMPRFDKALKKRLQEQVATIYVPDSIGWGSGAETWLNDWSDGKLWALKERTPDEMPRQWLERRQANMMKMACLRHLVEHHEGGICIECLERVDRVMDYTFPDVKRLYHVLESTKEGEAGIVVMDYIRRAGGMIEEKMLRRRLRNQFRKQTIQTTLMELRADGDLRAKKKGMETVWEVTSLNGKG